MKKKIKIFLFALAAVLMLSFAACSGINYTVPESFDDGDQLNMPEEGELIAIFDTSLGEMRVRLFPSLAPKAVENFRKLAGRGYYNDITFHRVLIGEIIQSGDPTGTGQGGTSIWGKGFADEKDNHLYHYRGALSYAKSMSAPEGEKNMSQFFFVTKNDKYYQVDYNELLKKGYTEKAAQTYLDARGQYEYDFLYNTDGSGYVVFGQLYEGWDVLDAIASVKIDGDQKPIETVRLNSVSITTYTKEETK